MVSGKILRHRMDTSEMIPQPRASSVKVTQSCADAEAPRHCTGGGKVLQPGDDAGKVPQPLLRATVRYRNLARTLVRHRDIVPAAARCCGLVRTLTRHHNIVRWWRDTVTFSDASEAPQPYIDGGVVPQPHSDAGKVPRPCTGNSKVLWPRTDTGEAP